LNLDDASNVDVQVVARETTWTKARTLEVDLYLLKQAAAIQLWKATHGETGKKWTKFYLEINKYLGVSEDDCKQKKFMMSLSTLKRRDKVKRFYKRSIRAMHK
jgi:hypothetical protein